MLIQKINSFKTNELHPQNKKNENIYFSQPYKTDSFSFRGETEQQKQAKSVLEKLVPYYETTLKRYNLINDEYKKIHDTESSDKTYKNRETNITKSTIYKKIAEEIDASPYSKYIANKKEFNYLKENSFYVKYIDENFNIDHFEDKFNLKNEELARIEILVTAKRKAERDFKNGQNNLQLKHSSPELYAKKEYIENWLFNNQFDLSQIDFDIKYLTQTANNTLTNEKKSSIKNIDKIINFYQTSKFLSEENLNKAENKYIKASESLIGLKENIEADNTKRYQKAQKMNSHIAKQLEKIYNGLSDSEIPLKYNAAISSDKILDIQEYSNIQLWRLIEKGKTVSKELYKKYQDEHPRTISSDFGDDAPF